MSRPCAFCANRSDCRAEKRNCAVVGGDGEVEWVKYEPWSGWYETKNESKKGNNK